jgi:signal peptidase I
MISLKMNKVSDNHIIVKNIGFSLLAEGTTIRVKTDGYSMYPFIKPGAIILIEPLKEESVPVPGEIIAWKRESGFVVHRLVRIVKSGNEVRYITRGDSCSLEDQPVSKEQIAGKVVRIETGSGKIKVSGNELIRKPVYLYNRLILWILIRFRRILIGPPIPLKGG